MRAVLRQRELARPVADDASRKAVAQVERVAETMVERLVAAPAFQTMDDT